MPFPQQSARAFTKQNIEAIRPGTIGVYGLFRPNAFIYIGRGDIRARLLSHLNGENPCITREKPTHYIDEVATNDENREKDLILEFDPICNKKVG